MPVIWRTDVRFFDIVNGFFNRCRGAAPVDRGGRKTFKGNGVRNHKYLAELMTT